MALSSFQKAFKEAREKGETEFEFGGKKYNTKYKEEVKTSAKPVSPMPAAPRGMTDDQNDMMAKANRGMSSKPYSTLSKPAASTNFSATASDEEKVANRKAIGDTVMAIPRGIGSYLDKTFTMEGREQTEKERKERLGMKRGGSVKKMASGGNVSSASKRADGIAQKGKTRGKMC